MVSVAKLYGAANAAIFHTIKSKALYSAQPHLALKPWTDLRLDNSLKWNNFVQDVKSRYEQAVPSATTETVAYFEEWFSKEIAKNDKTRKRKLVRFRNEIIFKTVIAASPTPTNAQPAPAANIDPRGGVQ